MNRDSPYDGIDLRSLLVAIDGSTHSDLALAAAISIAQRENAIVTLIAVAYDIGTNLSIWPSYIPPSVAQADCDREAQDKLDRAIALTPVDIGVRSILARGRPGPVIIDHATRGDFDAVLMGARGLSGVRGAVGSVSQYVMHHAPITVFTAHQAPQQGPGGTDRCRE